MGAVNLADAYAGTEQLDKAQSVYTELKELAEAHPSEAAIRELQGNAACDILVHYGTKGQKREMEAMRQEIERLLPSLGRAGREIRARLDALPSSLSEDSVDN